MLMARYAEHYQGQLLMHCKALELLGEIITAKSALKDHTHQLASTTIRRKTSDHQLAKPAVQKKSSNHQLTNTAMNWNTSGYQLINAIMKCKCLTDLLDIGTSIDCAALVLVRVISTAIRHKGRFAHLSCLQHAMTIFLGTHTSH